MSTGATRRTVLGSVLIFQPANYAFVDDIGQGAGELADLVPGAPVVFQNEHGRTIGETVLEAGILSKEGNCRMRYMVEIPVLDRYDVTVGQRAPDRIVR